MTQATTLLAVCSLRFLFSVLPIHAPLDLCGRPAVGWARWLRHGLCLGLLWLTLRAPAATRVLSPLLEKKMTSLGDVVAVESSTSTPQNGLVLSRCL